MKFFRLILSIAVASWMTGIGNLGFAQESNSSPFSITLAPLQYAHVKGNVGKFEALNWMPNGATAGVSDISFVKDINKDISLSIEGSEFTNDNGTGELTLKDGDLAFLHIDYNAFRKYYDGTGGVDKDTFTYPSVTTSGSTHTTAYLTGAVPSAYNNGYRPNSPDLDLDISYFKLEAGLGPISDPMLDIAYEHNSKDGYKSLLEWTYVYLNPPTGTSVSNGSKKIGPAWQSVNAKVDTLTLKEKKEFAGITFKGQQSMEVDYNSSTTYMQYLNDSTAPANQLNTVADRPDAKLFGSGVRAEKWMFHDNTFVGLGYHYNHTHSTDMMERQAYSEASLGAAPVLAATNSSTSYWSYANAAEDEHVLVGNLNTNITPTLSLLLDGKYEHKGTDADSDYNSTNTSPATNYVINLGNHEDQEGEHAALHYSGISHTTLYAETEFQQDRNWVSETYNNSLSPLPSNTNNFTLERLARSQNESWTLGGRVVPNRFFTFTSQLKQHDKFTAYDTIQDTNATVPLMDSIRDKGIDETSTLTWKPLHWLQNSLKYQFSDTVENPKLSTLVALANPAEGYNATQSRMLTSAFTYDITVQPIDPLLLMLTYSHVENYVRTIAASDGGSAAEGGPAYIPTFNSGSNSWAFSSSYSPLDNLTWNNTVDYTISNNYVDFNYFLPLGSSFKELRYTTGIDWTYHKWLKIGPKYEYASYRDNPLVGAGNYVANIFMLDARFRW